MPFGPILKPFIILFVFAVLVSVNSLAAEEEQYKPIPELNYHAPKSDEGSIFDEVRLHAGAIFLNSFQSVPLGSGQRATGDLRGAELNFGMDMFSPKWILQGAIFSLPQTTLSNNAQVSASGFGLDLVYESALTEGVTAHGLMGIESRNYSIKSRYGDNSMASGAYVIGGGIDYWPASFISAGVEISAHLPLASGDDPASLDLGVRVNGHF